MGFQSTFVVGFTLLTSLLPVLVQTEVQLCDGTYGTERYESVTQCPAGLLIMGATGAEVSIISSGKPEISK